MCGSFRSTWRSGGWCGFWRFCVCIGSESQEHVFEALATGGAFSPGFREAVDIVSVQQALITSWDTRRWEPVVDLGAQA